MSNVTSDPFAAVGLPGMVNLIAASARKPAGNRGFRSKYTFKSPLVRPRQVVELVERLEALESTMGSRVTGYLPSPPSPAK